MFGDTGYVFFGVLAEEESVKKREAMVWPLNRRFKDGKLLTPPLLGYDRPKDVTGRYIKYAPLEINKAEARIVNFIYDAQSCYRKKQGNVAF